MQQNKKEEESVKSRINFLEKKLIESDSEQKTKEAMIDKLAKTNKRLTEENIKLISEIKKKDNFDILKGSQASLMTSRIESNDEMILLRDRVKELEQENDNLSNEKDKLIVELSKLMTQEAKT